MQEKLENYTFYRIAITKFTLFRECDRLRKFVIIHDPGSKYRRHFNVAILFDLENLLTKGKNEYQASLRIVLKAKTEKDIPKDVASKFEKIMHDKMDVESWRKLVKWCIDYEYVLFWIQAMDPRNGPKEPWPAPLWDGPKMIMPQDLYHKFIEQNIPQESEIKMSK